MAKYRQTESQQICGLMQHLGWSHPEQMVSICRMGTGEKRYANEVWHPIVWNNLQSTAVKAGATSFTLSVNEHSGRCVSSGWSGVH